MTSLGFVPDLFALLFSLIVLDLSIRWMRNRNTPPQPPGPRGLPLIGNVLSIPASSHWLAFTTLGQRYGDIASLRIFSQRLIILNSIAVAEDLLDTHGANFSDRPVLPMAGALAGFDNVGSLCQYGERVRNERRLFHRIMGTRESARAFEGVEMEEIARMIGKLVDTGGSGVAEEIRRAMGAITLRIAYGYHVAVDGPDPIHAMFEQAGENFAASTRPMAYFVDIFPVLRFWPAWLPGGGFHTIARRLSEQVHATMDVGFDFVKARAAEGTAEPSFVFKYLEEGKHEEYLIKWAAGSVQVGGSDTSAAQISAFFLAMSLHPEVQKTAQEELDRVLAGTEAVPHRARADFVYTHPKTGKTMLIPKDAALVPNLWNMAHDPATYPNPFKFDPTRFLGPAGSAQLDPTRIVFGYGRRRCPGRFLADATLFLACASILAVLEISREGASANGESDSDLDIPEPIGQTTGTVSHPLPFACVVKPRGELGKEKVMEVLRSWIN
ncbi:Cytochrome P450 [Mycena kentingensis (nom. inval.)]|nr:Cytochrome P450 [Mycena kentingensis (nom. inval.)]